MTDLFGNSSPGALTREQAVELLKKRFAECQQEKKATTLNVLNN